MLLTANNAALAPLQAFGDDLLDFISRSAGPVCACDAATAGVGSPAADWGAGEVDDSEFEHLALRLFALQYQNVLPYQRWCASRGATPGRVNSWRDIPAVPTEAFKEYDFTSLPLAERSAAFYSSGTTELRP